MIPLQNNMRTRRFPTLTVSLIVMNILFFAIDKLTSHVEQVFIQTQSGEQGVVNVLLGGLSDHYSMVPLYITTEFSHYWHTIFTSFFLHVNWLHIGGNMLYLWIFGSCVEDTIGKGRFLILYFGSGLIGAMAHIYSNTASTVPTLGASGAVAGLMGAYIVLFPKAEILTIVPIFFIGTVMDVPAIVVIGFWAVLQFINATWLGGATARGGGVAYWAHAGGFAGGIIIILLMGGRRFLRRQDTNLNEEHFLPE